MDEIPPPQKNRQTKQQTLLAGLYFEKHRSMTCSASLSLAICLLPWLLA